jgi:hypothetical protein
MGLKFRVLRGNHAEGKYPEGHPWAGRQVVYEIGEIVESKTDLARKLNCFGPLGPKFQRIYDASPATDKAKQALDLIKRQEREVPYDDGNGMFGAPVLPVPDDGLEKMSLSELRKLAKEEGINLPTNATVEDAVKAIRSAAVGT